MDIALPGLPSKEGDRPKDQGGNKSMSNNNNSNSNSNPKKKKDVLLSKQIIKESEDTLVFALMSLGISEFFKRPIKTSVCISGSVVVAGVFLRLALGVGASLFSIELPQGVSTSTQVGFILTDVTKSLVVETGKGLAPGLANTGIVLVNVTNQTGKALVSSALQSQSTIPKQKGVVNNNNPNNLLIHYQRGNTSGVKLIQLQQLDK